MNRIQEIQFELMVLGSFNDFDGRLVSQSLRDHSYLWESFAFGRYEYGDLIFLRDMKSGRFNGDTLYIIIVPGKENELLELAKTWGADEIDVIPKDKLFTLLGTNSPMQLLRVWWD